MKDILYAEKYTDKSTGEEKTNWKKIGVLYEKDGKQSIKLEHSPIWYVIKEQKPKEQKEVKQDDSKAPWD